MVRVKCPYCGAEYDAPAGATHAVCPYCGTVVELETGKRAPQYYYPARLEEQDAYAAAISRARQLPAAPDDVDSASVYRGGELHYIPLYICSAKAEARGCEGAVEEVEKVFPASDGGPQGMPRDYAFPAVGRVPFDPREARRGKFHQATRDHRRPCLALAERLRLRVASEASAMGCRGVAVDAESRLVGIAHYPIWLIKYSHPSASRELTALVDAVDANVLYLEYPIPASKRKSMAVLGGVAFAAGLLVAAGVGIATTAYALLSGIVGAAAAALPPLRAASARLGIYRYRQPRVEKTIVELRRA